MWAGRDEAGVTIRPISTPGPDRDRVLRLREQWQASIERPGSAARLALRYEIFLSRVALLSNNRGHELMAEQGPLQPALKQIHHFRLHADEHLADMSHELRTALNGLMDMLGLVREAPDDPRVAGWLAVAGDSAEHLLRLLDDTLDLSKLESDALVLSPQPVHLGQLLAEVQRLLRPAAELKQLQLLVQIDAALPEHVLADPTRLRQVLLNLLGNAIKFSDTGTVLLDCRPARGEQGQALLELEDTASASHQLWQLERHKA